MRHTTHPNVQILGTNDEGRWRPMRNNPELRNIPGLVAVRIDESLYFGNIEQMASVILRIGML
jgi:MFS superfamily sulfate permease-like transporter